MIDSSTHPLVAVGVPTRHRPALLRQTIDSILAQRYRPLEIVVGDNSENTETERMLAGLTMPEGVQLRYHRHRPPLLVSGNIGWVLEKACATRALLLHDDDLLCPGGLDKLIAASDATPRAAVVYGRLRAMAEDGTDRPYETARANRYNFRTPEWAGAQRCNLEAALRQQMAMDGYLVDAELVRQVRFRPHAVVGHWTDVDFSIRLALATPDRPWVFVDDDVLRFRETANSLLRCQDHDYGHLQFLQQLSMLDVPDGCREAYERLMSVATRLAVLSAAKAGDRAKAWELMQSRPYDLTWLHPMTVYRMFYIRNPALMRMINRTFRGLRS